MSSVVIYDRKGEDPVGLVVDGNNERVLRARGVTLLPVAPALLEGSGVGGYSIRHFGKGKGFDYANRRGCKTVLAVATGYRMLHWCARIIQNPRVPQVSGNLRLSADTTQQGVLASGVASQRTSTVVSGAPDDEGGWTVGGECEYMAPMNGILGLCLYGTLDGGHVMWLAVSQA